MLRVMKCSEHVVRLECKCGVVPRHVPYHPVWGSMRAAPVWNLRAEPASGMECHNTACNLSC